MVDARILDFSAKLKRVHESGRFVRTGIVSKVAGLTIQTQGPFASLGETCHIHIGGGTHRLAEVSGVDGDGRRPWIVSSGRTFTAGSRSGWIVSAD